MQAARSIQLPSVTPCAMTPCSVVAPMLLKAIISCSVCSRAGIKRLPVHKKTAPNTIPSANDDPTCIILLSTGAPARILDPCTRPNTAAEISRAVIIRFLSRFFRSIGAMNNPLKRSSSIKPAVMAVQTYANDGKPSLVPSKNTPAASDTIQ